MNTKDNRRAKDSRLRLSAALLKLAEKPGDGRITVKRVCERAGVNRSTFYAHFRDIYDIVENAQQVLLRELQEELSARGPDGAVTADEYAAVLLEHIRRHRFFYKTVPQLDIPFPVRALIETSHQHVFEDAVRPWCQSAGITDPIEMEYHVAYYQAGLEAVLRRWLQGGCRESDQQMVLYLRGCTPRRLNGEEKAKIRR